VKLRHLDKWTAGRQSNAETYTDLFFEHRLAEELMLPCAHEGSVHVYNQFTIRTSRRDDLQTWLLSQGIHTEVYYPSPLHLEPAFAYLGYGVGDFPNAEAACRDVLSLPIYPELTYDQQRMIVDTFARLYRNGPPNK
jgi:dTDP-4-amino-4,6-dideoxygalactose transaminase